jgi:single-strand DNA-binding protein
MAGPRYNKVILVGRLTRDPESRFAASGLHVSKMTLAVDRQVFSSNQEHPGTDFIPITAFGKTADFVSNYLQKGKLVLVEGRLQISKFQAQDGTSKYFTDVIADTVNFMDTKKSTEERDSSIPVKKTYGEESAFDTEELSTNSDVFEDGSSPAESNDDEVPF